MQLRRTHYSVTILYFRMRSPKAHDTYSCIAKIPTITERQVQLWSWLKIAFISSSLGQTECQQAQNHGIIIIDNIEKIRKIIHTILTQLYLDMMEFPFHWHNFSSRYSSSTSKMAMYVGDVVFLSNVQANTNISLLSTRIALREQVFEWNVYTYT